MADQRISEQQLQALDDADEYSLRHHSSEVSLLIDSYREVLAELETAHVACQLSIAENMQLRGEVKRLNSLPQDWLAADLVKHLVDKAQALKGGADGQMDDFAIVLLASAERLQRQEAVIDHLRAELDSWVKPMTRLAESLASRCLACGQHHAGMAGLPCPNMTPIAGGSADA